MEDYCGLIVENEERLSYIFTFSTYANTRRIGITNDNEKNTNFHRFGYEEELNYLTVINQDLIII